MKEIIHKLIIIGSGPAGLTAGIYAARANLNPLIITGQKPGGQLTSTTAVENWPGTKSILGQTLMQNMQEHAQQAGCTMLARNVINVTKNGEHFIVQTDKNENLTAQAIIIATGATPKRLNIPGEQTYWGNGVTTCGVCDGPFFKDKPIVIIGGGDTAMENASFMRRYTDRITIVQIEDRLTASAAMQERVINDPNITILYNNAITEIQGDGKQITAVVVENTKTKQKTVLPVNAVFIAIGLRPNTEPFKNIIELAPNGYIKVRDNTKTSVHGIFAAGDVHDYRYRQAITSAGAGCMAALDATAYLSEK